MALRMARFKNVNNIHISPKNLETIYKVYFKLFYRLRYNALQSVVEWCSVAWYSNQVLWKPTYRIKCYHTWMWCHSICFCIKWGNLAESNYGLWIKLIIFFYVSWYIFVFLNKYMIMLFNCNLYYLMNGNFKCNRQW